MYRWALSFLVAIVTQNIALIQERAGSAVWITSVHHSERISLPPHGHAKKIFTEFKGSSSAEIPAEHPKE
jgi:hypothetical protein